MVIPNQTRGVRFAQLHIVNNPCKTLTRTQLFITKNENIIDITICRQMLDSLTE